MDLINTTLLDIVTPPITLILLCIFLPLFKLPKIFRSFLPSSFFSTEDVAGKVVIITGASSGIGEQLAYEYARRGARLVLADKREKSMHEVGDRCLEIGSPDTLRVTADVSDMNDCKRIIDSAISHFGTLDHLVSNAGIITVSMFEDYEDITKARPVMDVNFWGSVYLTRLAIPHLRNTRGKIIVMSSSASWLHVPRMSIYNASKAAMLAFYETLRIEVGSYIHITIVTPGFVESEMTKGKSLGPDGRMIGDQDIRDVILSFLPLCKAEDCAKAIVKGACRGERYVTKPTWCRVTYFWKALFPELVDLVLRLLYIAKPLVKAGSPIWSLSKRIVDLLGLKEKLYPSSFRSPEIKTE